MMQKTLRDRDERGREMRFSSKRRERYSERRKMGCRGRIRGNVERKAGGRQRGERGRLLLRERVRELADRSQRSVARQTISLTGKVKRKTQLN